MELKQSRENVYSQYRESGIISELLGGIRVSELNDWCVEFCGRNGMHVSNTFTLVKKHRHEAI